MFTGIIKEIGIVKDISKKAGNLIIGILSERIINELEVGSSVSINGACQTVVNISNNIFFIESVEVTLKKTALDSLFIGDKVNLETAIKPTEGLDGHIVQGHVDGVGTIAEIKKLEGSWLYSIKIPEHLSEFTVEGGSIAIDGISLTIAMLRENTVTISIIPFTAKNTTVGERKAGDKVNIEVDVLGKYVKNFLEKKDKEEKITKDWLKKVGFL